MVVFGIDAHKRTHTFVAVDDVGKKLGTRTISSSNADHVAVLAWARSFEGERRFAVEDCRHLSRRLERDLLAAGETVVRVPPKMMANTRDSARTFGKSDPIDAYAVAMAALRDPTLPQARLDGPERELRLLVDHRANLIEERTRLINRARWHLHELDPDADPAPRSLDRPSNITKIIDRIAGDNSVTARLCRDALRRCVELCNQIKDLDRDIAQRTQELAPTLTAIRGCGPITAAIIIGETADIRRFKNKDAYARHNGTAPLPVWSGNKTRFRLSRVGNRQLNYALHVIALTQLQHHPAGAAYIAKRLANGDTKPEAIRALKRRLSDIIYKALLTDTQTVEDPETEKLTPAA